MRISLPAQMAATLFALLPYRSLAIVPGVTVFRVACAVAAVVVVAAILRRDRMVLLLPMYTLTVGVFFLGIMISTILPPGAGQPAAIPSLGMVVGLFLLAVGGLGDGVVDDILSLTFRRYVWFALPLLLTTLLMGFRGDTRPMPLGLDLNYAGYLLVLASIGACSGSCGFRQKTLSALFALGAIMTASRGAVLLLVIAIFARVFFSFMSSHGRKKVSMFAILLALMATGATLAVFPQLLIRGLGLLQFSSVIPVRNLAGKMLYLVLSGSDARQVLWKVGFSQFVAHPIFGAGLDSLGSSYAVLRLTNTVAHSAFIQVLAEGGLVATVPFALLWVMPLLHRRCKSNLDYAVVGAMSVTLVNAALTGSLYDAGMWLVLGLSAVWASARPRSPSVRDGWQPGGSSSTRSESMRPQVETT